MKMKKQSVLCRHIAVLLLFGCLLLTACGENHPPVDADATLTGTGDESGSEAPPASEGLPIVLEGKSDYVIICNFQDTLGKNFANDFWQLIYDVYGVSLNIKSQSSAYEKEIIVGDTDRSASAAVQAQMQDSSDFAVCAVEDDLVLRATDAAAYERLLLAVRDRVLPHPTGQSFLFSPTQNLVASLNPNLNFEGNPLQMLINGGSEYTIVYPKDDVNALALADHLKDYIKESLGVSLPVKDDSSEYEYEIFIGAEGSRRVVQGAKRKLASEQDFALWFEGDDIAIAATDNKMYVLAMLKLMELCTDGLQTDGSVVLHEADRYVFSLNGRAFAYDAAEYCRRYQAIYGTYSSYHEDKLYNTSWLPAEAKDDQRLVEALIARMGSSAALSVGSSSVLYDGFVRKLDPADYSRAAKLLDGDIWIPQEFALQYFGEQPEANAEGYVNVSAYCRASEGYSLFYDAGSGIAVITPAQVASFADAAGSDGKYTNAQYIERMREFFHSAVIPEPGNNTEQSRVVVEYIEYPQYVLDFHTEEYYTTYSPSIVVVQESGRSVYYVSYEISLVCDYEELDVNTVVKKSVDGGLTWETVVEAIPDLRWSSIFENKGVIYLLGSSLRNGDAVIIQIEENGGYRKQILFPDAQIRGGTAPGSVLHANGRIYKAYHTAAISAPEDADLMLPASWTLSNRTNTSDLAPNGGEGSMVQGKDGQIYQVMHTNETQSAYVLKLSADGTTFTPFLPETNNIVEFPTCISKSSVLYDAVSGKYLSLTNICNTQNVRQRNVLALVCSDDLITWEIADYILVERELINPLYSTTAHAFQYTDFQIDGDDIVMVVREASGYANTYHDGNYTTFYRISNFRSLLPVAEAS